MLNSAPVAVGARDTEQGKPAAARATFRLLGPVEAEVASRQVPLGAPKQRLLFAFLLLHANEVVPRERTIDFLWGEDPPPAPSKSLQVYVHGLRKELGSGRIETRGTGYVLTVGSGELDLHRFDRLVSDGRAALEKGSAALASERLTEALELWRGEPLGDLSSDSVEPERASPPRTPAMRTRAADRCGARTRPARRPRGRARGADCGASVP